MDGELVDITGLDKPLRLKAGPHGLTVTGVGFETVTRDFTAKKDDREIVRITLKKAPARAAPEVAKKAPEIVKKKEDPSKEPTTQKEFLATIAELEQRLKAVSYTHLTLPTNREV